MPPLPAIPGLPIPTGAPGYSPPATPAPAPTPSVPGVPAGLDPKAFILTKAIAYQENGGKTPSYTAKGGSGEYGAYQYTPATWNARAAKYLGPNAPALTDATPDQQNQVQYDWVNDKLNSINPNTGKNYTPAEVASMHNAGEGAPDAYLGNAGTNKYGVKYDTKAYTDGVQKYAEQLYSGIDPAAAAQATGGTPAAPPTPPTLGGQAEGVLGQLGDAWKNLTTAAPTDNGLEAGLKATANLVPSAFNFAKGALQTLNPLHTVGNIAQIPGAFEQAVQANGGDVGKTLGYAFGAAPGAAYDGVVPEATRDVIKAGVGFAQHPDQIGATIANLGDGPGVPTPYTPGIDDNLQKASAAVTNDPFGQTAPIVFGADALAGGIDAATGKMAVAKNAAADAATGARTADYVNNIDTATQFKSPIPETAPRATGTNLQGAFRGAVETAASPVTKAGNVFGRGAPAEETAAPTSKNTDAAGKIVQGTTGDAATAARVLSQVSTKGVKTYGDLSESLGQAIKDNLTKTDLEHAKNPEPVKMSNLTEKSTSNVGGKATTAKINYVQTALTHLQELYRKTQDPANLARIRGTIQKAKTTGLTSSEINGIAREYGNEFGNKAFSKRTGDPLTSVNAQAYENVRSGVKNTARSLLPDDAAKALDKHTSDMIRVKKLVDAMGKKVNSLEQRVVKRNIVEKVARGLGSAIDFATFGGPKAFVQKLFFPSNVGLKTMNSIDLENQLQGNLKQIRSFENASDDTFAGAIVRAAKAVNALPSARIAPVSVFGRRQTTAAQ